MKIIDSQNKNSARLERKETAKREKGESDGALGAEVTLSGKLFHQKVAIHGSNRTMEGNEFHACIFTSVSLTGTIQHCTLPVTMLTNARMQRSYTVQLLQQMRCLNLVCMR